MTRPAERPEQVGGGARPRGRSFTLIELLVVVVLLGLAATAVTIGVRGATDTARLRAATAQLEQMLRMACWCARTRHESVWLQLQPGTGQYRLLRPSQPDGPALPWKSLDGVVMARATIATTPGRGSSGETWLVRTTPGGSSLPWALELQVGPRRRVVWTDGVTARLHHVDDRALDEVDWTRGLFE